MTSSLSTTISSPVTLLSRLRVMYIAWERGPPHCASFGFDVSFCRRSGIYVYESRRPDARTMRCTIDDRGRSGLARRSVPCKRAILVADRGVYDRGVSLIYKTLPAILHFSREDKSASLGNDQRSSDAVAVAGCPSLSLSSFTFRTWEENMANGMARRINIHSLLKVNIVALLITLLY